MADLKTLDDVERWLKEPGRAPDQIVVLARRAALRAVPALTMSLPAPEARREARLHYVLACFRAAAASWAFTEYPIAGAEIAAASAVAAANTIRPPEGVYDVARATAAAARASTAAKANGLDKAADLAIAAIVAAANAVRGADAHIANNAFGDTRADTALFAAVKDANLMRDWTAPDDIVKSPLWHDVPVWAQGRWSDFCKLLVAAREDWDVWIKWYEQRLQGAPLGLPLERALLELSDDEWEQGPAHVNRRLKEITNESLGTGEREEELVSPVEPEPGAKIATLDDLSSWLTHTERTRKELSVFAARAALRVLPALGTELESARDMRLVRVRLLLPVFRELAASCLAIEGTRPNIRRRHEVGAAPDAELGSMIAASSGAAAQAARAAADAAGAAEGDAAAAAKAAVSAMRSSLEISIANLSGGESRATQTQSSAATQPNHHMIIDANFLSSGGKVNALAHQPLWHGEEPKWAQELWAELSDHLLTQAEDWEVWIEWYEQRLRGARLGLPLERACAELTERDWNQGPAYLNHKLKEIIAAAQSPEPASDGMPPEPEPGPGPDYGPKQGKLSAVPHLPSPEEFESQVRLHDQLKGVVGKLTSALQTCRNQYPELANAADEYEELVGAELAEIDVTGVWSVGGSLSAFSRAYARQATDRTIAEPLEPQVDSALASVVRNHGAFILGFEEGRDLVGRADQFALEPAVIAEIEEPGNVILNELTENAELVDERTRKLHRPIRDAVIEYRWQFSRAGYAAYLTVRKAVHAMIRYTVGEGAPPGVAAATLIGLALGGSTLLGDPNAQFIRAAVPVLREHGAQILAFFNHSPEFRAYVEYALNLLDSDHRNVSED